jgi:putative MATE family efflux protein
VSRTASLLEDPIPRLFLRLSPAGILGMLIIGLYSLVDGIFVGRIVGPEGLSAITLCFPLSLLAQGLSALVGIGSASVYSRLLGSGDRDRARTVFILLCAVNLVLCAAFAAIVLPLLPHLLGFLGAGGRTLELATLYGAIVLGGTIFANLMSSANMLIRAEGHMNTAMAIMAIGAILNTILDPLLMIVLKWGIGGAAIATVASQALSALLSILYFLRGKGAVKVSLRLDRHSPRLGLEIVSVGLSGLALPLLTLIQSAIVLKAVEAWGRPEDFPVVGAAMRVLQFIIIPIWGTAQALQPIIGTNYGAGKYSRVRRAWLLFSLFGTAIALVLWLPMVAFPRFILGFFLADEAILERGAAFMRLYMVSFPIYAFMLMTLTLFQATGKAVHAALLILGKFLVLFAPVLLVAVRLWGVNGIFLATPIADALIAIYGLIVLAIAFPGKGLADKGAALAS